MTPTYVAKARTAPITTVESSLYSAAGVALCGAKMFFRPVDFLKRGTAGVSPMTFTTMHISFSARA